MKDINITGAIESIESMAVTLSTNMSGRKSVAIPYDVTASADLVRLRIATKVDVADVIIDNTETKYDIAEIVEAIFNEGFQSESWTGFKVSEEDMASAKIDNSDEIGLEIMDGGTLGLYKRTDLV